MFSQNAFVACRSGQFFGWFGDIVTVLSSNPEMGLTSRPIFLEVGAIRDAFEKHGDHAPLWVLLYTYKGTQQAFLVARRGGGGAQEMGVAMPVRLRRVGKSIRCRGTQLNNNVEHVQTWHGESRN